jgi:hypothetical protein
MGNSPMNRSDKVPMAGRPKPGHFMNAGQCWIVGQGKMSNPENETGGYV